MLRIISILVHGSISYHERFPKDKKYVISINLHKEPVPYDPLMIQMKIPSGLEYKFVNLLLWDCLTNTEFRSPDLNSYVSFRI